MKNRLQDSCFPVNFARILRILFYRIPLGDWLFRSWCEVVLLMANFKEFQNLKIYFGIRNLNHIVKNLIIKGSIGQRLSCWFCLSLRRNWQCKKKVFNCFDISTTVTQGGLLTQFLNLWQRLCLLKWLNFSCSLLINFTPFWSCIGNCDFVLIWRTALASIWIVW